MGLHSLGLSSPNPQSLSVDLYSEHRGTQGGEHCSELSSNPAPSAPSASPERPHPCKDTRRGKAYAKVQEGVGLGLCTLLPRAQEEPVMRQQQRAPWWGDSSATGERKQLFFWLLGVINPGTTAEHLSRSQVHNRHRGIPGSRPSERTCQHEKSAGYLQWGKEQVPVDLTCTQAAGEGSMAASVPTAVLGTAM